MIRRFLAWWTAPRCDLLNCRKRGGGTSGLVEVPDGYGYTGLVCADHITRCRHEEPVSDAEWDALVAATDGLGEASGRVVDDERRLP